MKSITETHIRAKSEEAYTESLVNWYPVVFFCSIHFNHSIGDPRKETTGMNVLKIHVFTDVFTDFPTLPGPFIDFKTFSRP